MDEDVKPTTTDLPNFYSGELTNGLVQIQMADML